MSLDFDKFGNRTSSILSDGRKAKTGTADLIGLSSIPPQDYTPGVVYSNIQEVQTNRVSVGNLVGTSTIATTSGSVNSNTYAFLKVGLTPTQQLNSGLNNMGIPFISLIEGTNAAGFQIFPGVATNPPVGGSEHFRCYFGFDFASMFGPGGTSSASYATVAIWNNTGTTANLFAQIAWKYVQNNGGKSS